MTFDRTRYCIHTGADGRLLTTTTADVDALFARLRDASRVVVHFHGGLVSTRTGFAVAERLTPTYEAAGATPVFFVWSSGIHEVVGGNLSEIFGEDIFQRLLSRVTSIALRKLGDDTRETVGSGDDLRTVEAELARRDSRDEPFADFRADPGVGELTDEERRRFEAELDQDGELRRQLQTVLEARLPETTESIEGGAVVRTRASAQSLMSPEVLAELDAGTSTQEGLVSTATLGKKAVQALAAVVRRFRADTDHGLYCTVVEELLRAFDLANAGGTVWHAMKRETEDTFADSAEPRGGRLFMDGLAELAAARPDVEVTLVGHSTGAVFIDNLLVDLAERKAAGTVPAEFRIKNVVFLAPAATFAHVAKAVQRWDDVADGFRMFTMSDEAEIANHLVPRVYPRSLLYFVSGVVERGPSGRSGWAPIVGQRRYYEKTWFDIDDDIAAVGAFVDPTALHRRVVWSPTDDDEPAGFRSTARDHGTFDDDAEVRASLQEIVRG
ncbi:MAG TPA: hypothetical protein VF423_14910 [Actinomycetes bacterium]